MHSVTDIRVPPVVPIQPKTVRFPQRPLDFKNPEQRSVYSRRGSTVVTMKRKILCYAYRSQNLDPDVLIEKTLD